MRLSPLFFCEKFSQKQEYNGIAANIFMICKYASGKPKGGTVRTKRKQAFLPAKIREPHIDCKNANRTLKPKNRTLTL